MSTATDLVLFVAGMVALWFWLPVMVFLIVKFGRLGWLVAAQTFERKFK